MNKIVILIFDLLMVSLVGEIMKQLGIEPIHLLGSLLGAFILATRLQNQKWYQVLMSSMTAVSFSLIFAPAICEYYGLVSLKYQFLVFAFTGAFSSWFLTIVINFLDGMSKDAWSISKGFIQDKLNINTKKDDGNDSN